MSAYEVSGEKYPEFVGRTCDLRCNVVVHCHVGGTYVCSPVHGLYVSPTHFLRQLTAQHQRSGIVVTTSGRAHQLADRLKLAFEEDGRVRMV